jgi:hypothetical protein
VASLSFRDRFFSPPVARAVTSPSAIVATGAGIATGIVLGALTGGIGWIALPVIGGVLGYGGRVAVAIPRNDSPVNVDPFGVDEPWRRAVMDALRARNRFREAIKAFKSGPLRDALDATGDHIDEAVEECWKVAQQGQLLSVGRKRIDDREIQWELQQQAAQIPAGGQATPTQARTIASLNAQAASAQRMDELIRSTYDELGLINARLDEAVTEAIELSVSNRDLQPVSADVDAIVDSLTALRSAMTSLDDPAPTDLQAGSATAPAPPDPAPVQSLPDPPSGRPQTSPGA